MTRYLSGLIENIQTGTGLQRKNNVISLDPNPSFDTLRIANTADATSLITGAFQMKGGASITKSLYVGSSIMFPSGGAAAPTINTRSVGTRIIVYPELTPAQSDYAIGVESHHMWYSGSKIASGHKWYAADQNIMTLNSTSLILPQTSDASSLTTGALQVKGGASITKNLYIGGYSIIGTNTTGVPNMLAFAGFPQDDATTGPNVVNSAIIERAYLDKKTELVIFKGNNAIEDEFGPDRVRVCAPEFHVDCSSTTTTYNLSTDTFPAGTRVLSITSNGISSPKNIRTTAALYVESPTAGQGVLRLVSSGGQNFIQSGLTDVGGSTANLILCGINGGPVFATFNNTSCVLNANADSTAVGNGAVQTNGGISAAKNIVTGQRVLIKKGATNNYASIGYEPDGTTFSIRVPKSDGTSLLAFSILEDGTVKVGDRVI